MFNSFFKQLEEHSEANPVPLADIVNNLSFNEQGLLPVITQDATTKQVLMFAWMNRYSLEMTIATKQMTYWSRSRNSLWIKGETSGHKQTLINMFFDCDGDTLLCQVKQVGPACHTGRNNCFYLQLDDETTQIKVLNGGRS